MSIYTRTGDTGTTSLFGGKRVLKCEELVDVYGSIDELNSWVGLIASDIEVPDVQQFLQNIQSDLFTIGSYLAGWKANDQGSALTGPKGRALEDRVKEMEARIDAMEQELPKLHHFILPGGSELGSSVHITRSVCRRVERQTVALTQMANDKWQMTNENKIVILKYLNRLSDLFFMLARFINKQANKTEIIWSGKGKE